MKRKSKIHYFFTLMNGNGIEYQDGTPFCSHQDALDAGTQYISVNRLNLRIVIDAWPNN